MKRRPDPSLSMNRLAFIGDAGLIEAAGGLTVSRPILGLLGGPNEHSRSVTAESLKTQTNLSFNKYARNSTEELTDGRVNPMESTGRPTNSTASWSGGAVL